ncbi:MAG: hypothetical protein AB2598_15505 [Candidatus Thiodiazotropha sp.]
MNLTTLIIETLGNRLEESYLSIYGPQEPMYPKAINYAARMVLELIANSDALYHDVHHTVQVTLVGEAILRGRHMIKRVSPDDWLHFIGACLLHDIGYVRGVCPGDTDTEFVIDAEGNRVTPPRGASDAFLTPYHVDRGILFTKSRGKQVPYIDTDRLARAIELTRFPVPDSADHQETDTEAGLVRAADLIGQLGDPDHMRRLTGLYYEFLETGTAERLGYTSAADLAEDYPVFFWNVAQPYLKDALRYLQLTQEGKQWIANLHSHVFAVEHGQFHLGPFCEKKSAE